MPDHPRPPEPGRSSPRPTRSRSRTRWPATSAPPRSPPPRTASTVTIELAQARERLFAATEQTVIAAAGAEQPAVSARWWVVVPYRAGVRGPAAQLRDLAAGARGRTSVGDAPRGGDREPAAHRAGRRRAAARRDRDLAAGRHPDAGAAVGAAAPRRRRAPRLRGARRRLPDRRRDHARRRPQPDRHRILEARSAATRRRLDLGEHPRWIRHGDGTLEETIHLATPPAATDPSWLAYLLTCPLPATLAVHISVGVRSAGALAPAPALAAAARRGPLQGAPRPAGRLRRGGRAGRGRDRRRRARRRDRRHRLPRSGSTARSATRAATPRPFERTVKQTCADFHTLTNARVVRGRHLALDRVHLHAAARRRRAPRPAPLRAAQHRALRRR